MSSPELRRKMLESQRRHRPPITVSAEVTCWPPGPPSLCVSPLGHCLGAGASPLGVPLGDRGGWGLLGPGE